MSSNAAIPFEVDDWVMDRNNPSQPGQYTGKSRKAGPQMMVQLRYPTGETTYRPLTSLEKMAKAGGTSIADRIKSGHFGKLNDLQRLITYEKLKGTLHEVIYSMEAAQIDFYPYQFKPVIKFINSPTERLIIADEVGLGKTIESALIWLELQARRQARRLLVVCPKILAEKWRDELRTKFLFDARVVDFRDLQMEVEELKTNGPAHPFVLISTYTGLRPPKPELRLLNDPPDDEGGGSPKTRFLREMRHWSLAYEPFDMVIFDEAHYMRNPATTTFHLGESLAASAGAVLCVSATPVNNSNVDLHSLLRLVDESFFETQGMFEELLEANRPAVQASNALARTPVDQPMLQEAVTGMSRSPFISKSPLFRQLLDYLEKLDPANKALLAKCQDVVEKLNLLGNYVNRTRRIQVKENRPLRVPVVLELEYSPEEARLYRAILELVRRKCRQDNRVFHIFQVLGIQLRAASCLPALAQEVRNGRLGDARELLAEGFGEEVYDGVFDEEPEEEWSEDHIEELLAYDFEKNDSKYAALEKMLCSPEIADEKVVIFAFYRPTLAYLRRRLLAADIRVATIHGGIKNEQRWEELDRFRDPNGPRVLLSSEVGSEGIDLQFCRVVVNYDLPWNPMRVEQRIGRIDRVGQQAKRLSIVNFKIKDTVEERLYDRLHSKLDRFANSMGDLEAVIGKVVQDLTVELLSKALTAQEEALLMENAERVIEERLVQIQALEESGDALLALSDYVQKKIEEDRGKGRYIQADELEAYLLDFFEREFRGCEVAQNTPEEGCFKLRLSPEAQSSLAEFIRDDRSLSARPLRQREFAITFRREVLQRLPSEKRRTVNFANHLSPLIRWITKHNQERAHSFYNLSALKLSHNFLPSGTYCYRIERWRLKGLSNRENLAYTVRPLNGIGEMKGTDAESIIQYVLRNAKDWDYVDCDCDQVLDVHEALEEELGDRFSETAEEFHAENETAHQIKERRVQSIFDRRIEQTQQRLRTLIEANRSPRVIHATEGMVKTAQQNKEQRLDELKKRAAIDMEQTEVAAGVFRVDEGQP